MLLTTGRDLGYITHYNLSGSPHPDTVYYPEDFSDPQSELGVLLETHANMELNLDAGDDEIREDANRYVQRAIAFIAATPYTYLQEGR